MVSILILGARAAGMGSWTSGAGEREGEGGGGEGGRRVVSLDLVVVVVVRRRTARRRAFLTRVMSDMVFSLVVVVVVTWSFVRLYARSLWWCSPGFGLALLVGV
jgi:hypothetical protein